MWKLYAATQKGVAVCTTAGRLSRALQPFRLAPEYGEEEPYWGPIRYVDLHREGLRVGVEHRFFYKHRAFEWAREFRVAISVRIAEELVVFELGIQVSFDPAELIESVYLAPALTDDSRELIREACREAGVTARVVTSTLLGRPRYT